jgi:arylsulfatase A-like enzyme
MDLTATILAAAGTSPPADHPLDGIDLLPIARGIAPVVARELFWRVPGRNQRAVRAGPWKLLVDGATGSGGAMIFLFDLRTDPGERHDLAMRYHERVVTLRARLAVWEKEVGETSR